MVVRSKGPGKLGRDARLVQFLKSESFNSNQIKYICTKILKFDKKRTSILYHKIQIYSKNIEIRDAIRKFRSNQIMVKLKLQKLL